MPAMRKRRLIRWSLILVILAAFAVWLEPMRVVWGWLRGDAFYQGRPTSYWASQIARWEFCGTFSWNWRSEKHATWNFSYKSNALEQWLDRYPKFQWPAFPAVLTDDPAPQEILEELALSSDPHVRKIACERLRGTRMNVSGRIRIYGGVGY